MDTTQCNCKKDTVPSGRQFFGSLNYKHQKSHGMAEMSHFPLCRVASGVCSLRNHFLCKVRLEIWYRRTCCTTLPRCRTAGLPPEFKDQPKSGLLTPWHKNCIFP